MGDFDGDGVQDYADADIDNDGVCEYDRAGTIQRALTVQG